MFKIMLALHLLAVVFTIGPLAHAVTTASRGLRRSDAAATASSARMTTVYAYASILAVIFGFALMSSESPYTHRAVASFGETWIWLSLLLWAIAAAIGLTVTAPALRRAGARIEDGQPVGSMTGRVAASGGVTALLLLAVVVLMVYRP